MRISHRRLGRRMRAEPGRPESAAVLVARFSRLVWNLVPQPASVPHGDGLAVHQQLVGAFRRGFQDPDIERPVRRVSFDELRRDFDSAFAVDTVSAQHALLHTLLYLDPRHFLSSAGFNLLRTEQRGMASAQRLKLEGRPFTALAFGLKDSAMNQEMISAVGRLLFRGCDLKAGPYGIRRPTRGQSRCQSDCAIARESMPLQNTREDIDLIALQCHGLLLKGRRLQRNLVVRKKPSKRGRLIA